MSWVNWLIKILSSVVSLQNNVRFNEHLREYIAELQSNGTEDRMVFRVTSVNLMAENTDSCELIVKDVVIRMASCNKRTRFADQCQELSCLC